MSLFYHKEKHLKDNTCEHVSVFPKLDILPKHTDMIYKVLHPYISTLLCICSELFKGFLFQQPFWHKISS